MLKTTMTIEERLERLTERHEALTQTVEIIALMQVQNEARLGEMMESMNRLINVVEAHEQRPDYLEGAR